MNVSISQSSAVIHAALNGLAEKYDIPPDAITISITPCYASAATSVRVKIEETVMEVFIADQELCHAPQPHDLFLRCIEGCLVALLDKLGDPPTSEEVASVQVHHHVQQLPGPSATEKIFLDAARDVDWKITRAVGISGLYLGGS
jgi:hypothetical protein